MRLNNLAIVIAVKNGSKTIDKALNSINCAVLDGAKLYVFDSLSTDGTQKIVEKYFNEVNYFFEADAGLYFAWNKAINLIKEPYVFFLNCDDDLVSCENLRELLSLLNKNPNLVAAGGKTVMVREDGATRFGGQTIKRDWFVGDMPFVTPATIFSIAHLKKINGFDVQYKISADYDMFLRLLSSYGHLNIFFKDLPIVNFSLDGMSNKYRSQAFIEIKNIIKKNLGVKGAIYHYLVINWIEFKRYILSLYFLVKGIN